MRMPVLFIGHGAPTNALESNPFTKTLETLGRELPRPQAILCLSAHWMTEGPRISVSAYPKTIHDYYGFPPEMYKIQYPAPGALDRAKEVAKSLGLPEDS